jgi:hypothetical protein
MRQISLKFTRWLPIDELKQQQLYAPQNVTLVILILTALLI